MSNWTEAGRGGCLVAAPRYAEAVARLFCLPYAGGGAHAYRALAAAVAPAVHVVAIRLPGRESRYREPVVIDTNALAESIAHLDDLPYAIYGHSMGALLGFDVTRTILATDRTAPRRLYVAASRAPDSHTRGPLDGLSAFDDLELVGTLVRYGGMPEHVAADAQLLKLVLPTVRRDLAWCDAHRYRPGPSITTAITAIAGRDDPSVAPDELDDWRRHTSGGFQRRTLAGGHFFLDENLPALATLIGADLQATAAVTAHAVQS